jgi:hypothetical protein
MTFHSAPEQPAQAASARLIEDGRSYATFSCGRVRVPRDAAERDAWTAASRQEAEARTRAEGLQHALEEAERRLRGLPVIQRRLLPYLDAEAAAACFRWWPLEWKRVAIKSDWVYWPAGLLRGLIRSAGDLAEEKDRELRARAEELAKKAAEAGAAR